MYASLSIVLFVSKTWQHIFFNQLAQQIASKLNSEEIVLHRDKYTSPREYPSFLHFLPFKPENNDNAEFKNLWYSPLSVRFKRFLCFSS